MKTRSALTSPDSRSVAFAPVDQLFDNSFIGAIDIDGNKRHRLFSGRFSDPADIDWLR
jgi:hypothetical protein